LDQDNAAAALQQKLKTTTAAGTQPAHFIASQQSKTVGLVNAHSSVSSPIAMLRVEEKLYFHTLKRHE
jgi:hypothetical protein